MIVERASKLSDYNLLTPQLVKDPSLVFSNQKSSFIKETYGDIDQLSEESSKQFFGDTPLTGWAILPEKRRKADALIFTHEGMQEKSQPFAIVRVNQKCSNLPQQFNQSSYQESCWQYNFSTFQVPPDTKKITAWAFDTEIGKVHLIKSISLLPSSTSTNLTDFGKIKLSADQPVGNLDIVNHSLAKKQTIIKNSSVTLSGWAKLPQENRLPDKVLITVGNDNTIVAVTSVNGDRPDVVSAFKNPALAKSGWTTRVFSQNLQQQSMILKAWAYDAKNKVVYQIPGIFELKLQGDDVFE